MTEIDPNPTSFGDLLQRLRRAAGLTQEVLAERAGISVRGISDLERGIHIVPRADTLALIVDALSPGPDDRRLLLAAARRSSRPRKQSPDGGTVRSAAWPERAAIPRYMDEFVGRGAEADAIVERLQQERTRLLTITGPGGMGKTRLAVAVAERLAAACDLPDGVAFVPLVAVRNPDFVIPVIAQALGVREMAGVPLDRALASALAGRQVLLLLDNLEQVLAAGPRLANLLASTPSLKILATSRAPLRVAGEVRFPLRPLTLPVKPDADLERLATNPAVALYVRRLEDIDPGFVLTSENAATIATICQRLDGLPLAIELAATRSATLPLAALLQRLDHALPLLTHGSRDAPERQRTLRDAIAWSYDLLSPDEQALFRRLGIFVGGFALEAVEEIAKTENRSSVDARRPIPTTDHPTTLDLLTTLVEQSLVQVWEVAGEPRYSMLEAVREFAAEALAASNEHDAIARRHASWFRQMAIDAGAIFGGSRLSAARQRLDVEIGNLRVALDWFLRQEDVQPIAAMLLPLLRFWYTESRLVESVTWSNRVALRNDAFSMPDRARLQAARAYGLNMQSHPDALPLAQEAVALLRAFVDESTFTMMHLGAALFICGTCSEDTRTQRLYYEEAAELCRAADAQFWLAAALINLSASYFDEGDWDRAVVAMTEAMDIQRALEIKEGLAFAQAMYANLLRKHGDAVAAREHYGAALPTFTRIGALWEVAVSLEGLAAMVAATQPERATWLFGAAAGLRTQCGATTEPEWWGRTPEVVASLRSAMGDDEFTLTHAAGQAASSAESFAVAMAMMDSGKGGEASA